ncbi:MAG: sensor histidine kinase, partial [Bacteroidota bacterium]
MVKYETLYSNLRDSLDQDYLESINILNDREEARFQEKLSISEAQTLRAEQAQQTTIIFALSIGIALLLGLSFAIYRALRSERKEVKAKERALEAEKAILDKDLKIKDLLVEQELKSLSAMLEGQEKERNRIAKDLHDRLGGLLSTVKIHFQAVEKQITAIKLQNQEQYLKANQLLDDACAEVRKVALDLESGVLQQFGLIPALLDLKHTIEGGEMLEINLVDVGFEEKRLDAKMEIEIYRVIQELLSNIMRHAQASEVEIQLFRKEKNNLNITVEDNGKGFDPEAPDFKKGMGLNNIDYRVKQLGGEISIDSHLGKGTTTIIN